MSTKSEPNGFFAITLKILFTKSGM